MSDLKSGAAKPDGRRSTARRLKQLIAAFTADLGESNLSEAERSLIQRAAALTVRAEQIEAAMISGETIDDNTLIRLSNSASKVLNMLGVRKRKKQAPHVPAWRKGD